MERPMNVTIAASHRGGLIGWISGNSKRRTIERGIESLNRNGYHVILVLDDEWGLLGSILRLLLLFGTLGLFTLEEGHIFIGERGRGTITSAHGKPPEPESSWETKTMYEQKENGFDQLIESIGGYNRRTIGIIFAAGIITGTVGGAIFGFLFLILLVLLGFIAVLVAVIVLIARARRGGHSLQRSNPAACPAGQESNAAARPRDQLTFRHWNAAYSQ